MEAESAGTPLWGTAPWGGPPWLWGGCSSITWGGWGAPGWGGGAAVIPVWTWACREQGAAGGATAGQPKSPGIRRCVRRHQALGTHSTIAPGPSGSYLGNVGHVGEAVGQLLVGMDGIHSSWLGKAALRGLGRRSRWQRRRRACQGPWVVQILLWLSTAQVWGLPRLVLSGRVRVSATLSSCTHAYHPLTGPDLGE